MSKRRRRSVSLRATSSTPFRLFRVLRNRMQFCKNRIAHDIAHNSSIIDLQRPQDIMLYNVALTCNATRSRFPRCDLIFTREIFATAIKILQKLAKRVRTIGYFYMATLMFIISSFASIYCESVKSVRLFVERSKYQCRVALKCIDSL